MKKSVFSILAVATMVLGMSSCGYFGDKKEHIPVVEQKIYQPGDSLIIKVKDCAGFKGHVNSADSTLVLYFKKKGEK